jgi:hypothetical protein
MVDKVQHTSNFKQYITQMSEISILGLKMHIFYAGKHIYIKYTLLKSSIVCDITPCSPVKGNRRFGRAYRLLLGFFRAACYKLVSYLVYLLTLKTETATFSETSVHFHRTTCLYIAEERGNDKSLYLIN